MLDKQVNLMSSIVLAISTDFLHHTDGMKQLVLSWQSSYLAAYLFNKTSILWPRFLSYLVTYASFDLSSKVPKKLDKYAVNAYKKMFLDSLYLRLKCHFFMDYLHWLESFRTY